MNALPQKTFERLIIAGIIVLLMALVVVVQSRPQPPHVALDLPHQTEHHQSAAAGGTKPPPAR